MAPPVSSTRGSMTPAATTVDVGDPRWFPADLDVAADRVAMLHIDEEVVERSTFMDTRLEADLSNARVLDRSEMAPCGAPASPPGWLFHTSFCCSTLLARILSAPPGVMVFREPLLLRRLADARNGQRALGGWVEAGVNMLARPWAPSGRVLIKPTHAALNIAGDLMRASRGSRALVLTSSLDDFLISNVKKTEETQSRIPLLVERALQAGTWHKRLPPSAFAPPSLIAAAGLQWAAQRELLVELVAQVGPDRIRTLDAAGLLADVPALAQRSAAWLELPVDAGVIAERARLLAGRHAKLETRAFDRETRAAEAAMIETMFRNDLKRDRAWLDAHVLPAMSQDALQLSSGPLVLAKPE